jgi:hypothetical protein
MVCYVENCGRVLLTAVAVRFRRRRWLLSLHSVDFVDGRFIPIRDIAESGIIRLAWAIDTVRYSECCGSSQRVPIGRKYPMTGSKQRRPVRPGTYLSVRKRLDRGIRSAMAKDSWDSCESRGASQTIELTAAG